MILESDTAELDAGRGFVTVVLRERWIAPSFTGRSKALMDTPFLRPSKRLSETILLIGMGPTLSRRAAIAQVNVPRERLVTESVLIDSVQIPK
jgi:hypothetical protein